MAIRLTIYLSYYFINVMFAHDALAVLFTLPMMGIVLYHIARIDDRYFTMWDMVHFLMYLFFVIEPLQMIDHGRIGTDGPVSQGFYRNTDIGTAMAIATIFYLVVSIVLERIKNTRTTFLFYQVDTSRTPLLLVIIAVSFLAFVVLSGGIGNVMSSRFERHDALLATGGEALSALTGIASSVLIATTILLASQVRGRLDVATACLIPAMMIILFCFNPFNTSRFGLLAAYVPLIFMLMKGRIPAIPVYVASMFGIVVLMPILSTTSRFGLAGLSARGVLDANLLHLQFVDCFDLLVECVRFVAIHGYDHGLRLFADLVVYVPRALWPGKPVMGAIDVGQGLVDVHYFGTSNVSQLVAADGYMDFGFLGVVLVGLLVGFYLRAVFTARRVFINGHDLLTYVFVAALPILLRGPLTAVITPFLFQSLSFLAYRKLLGRRLPTYGECAPSGMSFRQGFPAHRTRVPPIRTKPERPRGGGAGTGREGVEA